MRKRLFLAAAVLVGLALLAALGLWMTWLASRREPAFYRAALEADPAAERAASDRMLQKSTAVVSDVRRPGAWQATITADEINGWLAVDLVEKHPTALPPSLSQPRVSIEPDQITVACRYREGWADTVLSLSADAYLVESDTVAIRLHGARAGMVPLPLEGLLERTVQSANEAGLRARRQEIEGDPVILLTVPPPKDARGQVVELEALELREGEIYVAGTTRANP